MLNPGDTFERYTVESVLGQGGMGCVYRARDTRLDRRVALKVVLAGDEGTPDRADANARLLREARAAAALDHPNAVSIFDVGEIESTPYIVMELVSGKTLRDAISPTSSVPIEERKRWLTDAAKALSAAHKRGIVHRDIKPENVMVRDDGMVKVLDFGIARRTKSAVDPSAPTEAGALPTLTAKGIHVGTPLYMSPEQIKGDSIDGRADQFAWGVVAYELITGRVPWKSPGDSLAVVASILTEEADADLLRSTGAPRPLRHAILRALSKKPEQRFASMEDLLASVEATEGSAPSGGAPTPDAARAKPPSTPSANVAGPSVTMQKRYSTEEVREILARAVEREANRDDGRFYYQDIVAAAGEVGVDADMVRQVSHELRLVEDEHAAYALWKRKHQRGFLRHFMSYLLVNAFLITIDVITGYHGWWIWPALGWGLGVAFNAMHFFTLNEDDWRREEAKRLRRELRRRKRQKQHEAVEKAIEEGVSLVLGTGRAIRDRVKQNLNEVTTPPKVRISPPTQSGKRVAAPPRNDTLAEAEREIEAMLEDDRRARRENKR